MSAPPEYLELRPGEWWHPPSEVYAEISGLRLGREGFVGLDQALAVARPLNTSERLLLLNGFSRNATNMVLEHNKGLRLPPQLEDGLNTQYDQTGAYVRNLYDAVQEWVELGGTGEVKGSLQFEGVRTVRPTKDLQPYVPFQPDRQGNVLGLGGLNRIKELFMGFGASFSELRNPQVIQTIFRNYSETVVRRRFPAGGSRISEKQTRQMRDSQTEITIVFVSQFFDLYRAYTKFIDSISGQQSAALTPKPVTDVH